MVQFRTAEINYLPLVVYPGNAGLPSGFAAFGSVPLISKSVWEYESPLPIESSQSDFEFGSGMQPVSYKVMKYCVVFDDGLAEPMADSNAARSICCKAMLISSMDLSTRT